MFAILLHSSKTMRAAEVSDAPYQQPALLHKTEKLADYLRTLSPAEIQTVMQISSMMAVKTHRLLADWTSEPTLQRPALDAFLGDIYSGLQVNSFSKTDLVYANDHLFILSGLYGILRALDSIHPYRLEMGYRLPSEPYASLYKFWGADIAKQLSTNSIIINLSAVEYTKALLPHLPTSKVITPKFQTINSNTDQPTFVTVHAKIARGAFARWLIQNRIEDVSKLQEFNDLGYSYDSVTSTPEQPVFICKEFKGIGLSVRLS